MLKALAELWNQIPPDAAETLGIWAAAVLTLAILSYALGNNPVFKLAEYFFVGMAAGYAAALAWSQMLWPRISDFIQDPSSLWYYGVFFALGLLLLLRGIRSLAPLGNLSMGVLFGTGAALALGGALTGSLVPQMQASILSVSPQSHGEGALGWILAIDAILLILGTLAVLNVFHFTAQGQDGPGRLWGRVHHLTTTFGRTLIMITFGALLAGAALSTYVVLYGRLRFLVSDWLPLFGKMGL